MLLGTLAVAGATLFWFGNAVLLKLGIADPALASIAEGGRWAWLFLGALSLVGAAWRRPAGVPGFVAPALAAVLSLGVGANGAQIFPAQFGAVPAPPASVEKAQADFAPDDWVLGVSFGDRARAYPWSLIQREFVINDTLAGDPVVVTYCISCNSSLAYRAELNGSPVRFGVVGVYRAETLLYDDATGSWWREDGSAVAGRLAGAQLEQLPAALVPWSEWIALYPETEVVLK